MKRRSVTFGHNGITTLVKPWIYNNNYYLLELPLVNHVEPFLIHLYSFFT